MIKAGVLGDVKHIRALWHRNFPGRTTATTRSPASSVRGIAAGTDAPRRLVPADPPRRTTRPSRTRSKQYGYDDVERTGPLAAVRPDRRRADGRAGQPPARRVPASSWARCTRWRSPASARSRSSTARGTSNEPRDRRPRLRDLRVPRQEPPAGPAQGQRQERRRRGHLLVDQHERFEPYGECLMGSRGHDGRRGGAERDAVQGAGARQGGPPRDDAKVTVTQAAGQAGAWKRRAPGAGRPRPRPAAGRRRAPAAGRSAAATSEEMERLRLLRPPVGPERRLRRRRRTARRLRPATAALPRRGGHGRRDHALTANLAMARGSGSSSTPEWFKADTGKVPDADVSLKD